MVTAVGAEMYEHAMPVAPAGRGVAKASEVTIVGAGRVVPSALPTVEAEGHEPVLIVEALVAGAEVALPTRASPSLRSTWRRGSRRRSRRRRARRPRTARPAAIEE